MMNPYHEGIEAFDRGDMPEMNPYDEQDAQHEEWLDGYLDADAAEAGE